MAPVSSTEAPAESSSPGLRRQIIGTVAALELLRGLASLDVFFWHTINCDSGFPHIPGLYRLVAWSRESVIIFFVLSGYVIALSQQRRHRPALPFFKARVKRIEPLYLIALAVTIVVSWIAHTPCTTWQIVGHLLFLQSFEGSVVHQISAGAPLWSLGIEFQFYMTLVLILALRRPALTLVWGVLSLIAVGIRYTGYVSSGAEGLLLEFLGLSPCWLLGYFFANFRSRYSFTLVQAIALFLLVPLAAYSDFGTVIPRFEGFDNLKCLIESLLVVPLIHTLAVRQLYPGAKPMPFGGILPPVLYFALAWWVVHYRWPVPFPLPIWFLLAVPVVFYGMAHLVLLSGPELARAFPAGDLFRRVSIFLGGASYALYVIHWPLTVLVMAIIPVLAWRWPVLLILVSISVVVLEYVVQPRLAALVDRLPFFRNIKS